MNLILSHQTVTVNGKPIPKLYGGFEENQPSILAKQIADLHDYKLKEINQLLKNNLDWFDEGIDFIDIKSVVISDDHDVTTCLLKFYTKEGLNRSSHIYLFSQQGYAMLCKLLKSELAKKIYKQMVREYFKISEMQQNEEIGTAIIKKQGRTEAEKYWLEGRLTEVIVAELKQNREEMKQNREEMNHIYLELREVTERLKAVEKQISIKHNSSQISKEKKIAPRKRNNAKNDKR